MALRAAIRAGTVRAALARLIRDVIQSGKASALSNYRWFPVPPSAIPLSDPGFDVPYGPNLYWNAGVEFEPMTDWKLRVDGYNLIEPFDKALSKRNYYFRLSEYNVQPASVSVSMHYRFGR